VTLFPNAAPLPTWRPDDADIQAKIAAAPDRAGLPRAPRCRPHTRSPDRQRSLERRRRCAASGAVPAAIAANFTTGEIAALAIIAAEVRKCGSCALFVAAIAAKAGVGHTTAQNAVRRAVELGLIHRQERRQSRTRSWANVLSIVSAEWRAWLRLGSRQNPPAFRNAGPTNNGFIPVRIKGRRHVQAEPALGTARRKHDPQRHISAGASPQR
jgi:hypothetical protein